MPSTKLPLANISIHPFEKSDLEPAFRLSEAAFADLNELLYTSPLSKTSIEAFLAPRYASFGTEPNSHSFKAVDSETGALAGISRWTIYEEDQEVDKSVSEIVEERLSVRIPERRDDELRKMYTIIQEGKRDLLSVSSAEYTAGKGDGVKYKKRVELENLAVHPDYQGQGIARRLLQWGIEEAARLGLDVHLEATRAGRPVYERMGFEVLRTVPYGGEGGETEVTFMVLPAK
ncbi:acyl-CoA N-acyltransferase [Aspergillus unguis]